ncbi:MAG: hypothetical protein ABI867_03665 [Kofleriaceae bacterium]
MAKPRKKPAKKKVALMAAFGDAPDAKAMLAHYGVPAKLAKCGFYFAPSGQTDWLFEKYPEKKVPAKVAEAGIHLLRALMDKDKIRATIGEFELAYGYHADLVAPALVKAFEAEGFRVEPFPFSKLRSIAYSPSDPWPAALSLLRKDEVEIRALLDALRTRQAITPPPTNVITLIASKLESKDDVRTLNAALKKTDLVASGLPLVARLWKPKKAKTKPRGLPAELATLLGAFDGIPALGVMTAKEIAERHAYLLQLAKGAKGVGKRDWGPSDKAIRINRFWRDGWIPFCRRDTEETIAIDLDPTAQGQKGQIIGVHLNPPTLHRYRSTLGEWLWNELERSWK